MRPWLWWLALYTVQTQQRVAGLAALARHWSTVAECGVAVGERQKEGPASLVPPLELNLAQAMRAQLMQAWLQRASWPASPARLS